MGTYRCRANHAKVTDSSDGNAAGLPGTVLSFRMIYSSTCTARLKATDDLSCYALALTRAAPAFSLSSMVEMSISSGCLPTFRLFASFHAPRLQRPIRFVLCPESFPATSVFPRTYSSQHNANNSDFRVAESYFGPSAVLRQSDGTRMDGFRPTSRIVIRVNWQFGDDALVGSSANCRTSI